MSGQKQKGFGYGGFAIKPKGIGLETQLAQMGYGLPSMSGRSHSSVLHIGKKRVRSEDEFVLLWIVIVVIVKSKFLVHNLYICSLPPSTPEIKLHIWKSFKKTVVN